MTRARCMVLALAMAALVASRAEAGGPFEALSRWIMPATPTPAAPRAYVTVPPAAAYAAPGQHVRPGSTNPHTVPRAYPYGWFGAHARPQVAGHKAYYDDSWELMRIRAE